VVPGTFRIAFGLKIAAKRAASVRPGRVVPVLKLGECAHAIGNGWQGSEIFVPLIRASRFRKRPILLMTPVPRPVSCRTTPCHCVAPLAFSQGARGGASLIRDPEPCRLLERKLLLPTPFEFLLLALASFRLTHFVVFDRLAARIRAPFVDQDGNPRGTGTKLKIGEGITCYWCTGIWIAGLLYTGFWLFPSWMKPTIGVLAIAGAQSAIESWVRRNMAQL